MQKRQILRRCMRRPPRPPLAALDHIVVAVVPARPIFVITRHISLLLNRLIRFTIDDTIYEFSPRDSPRWQLRGGTAAARPLCVPDASLLCARVAL